MCHSATNQSNLSYFTNIVFLQTYDISSIPVYGIVLKDNGE